MVFNWTITDVVLKFDPCAGSGTTLRDWTITDVVLKFYSTFMSAFVRSIEQ